MEVLPLKERTFTPGGARWAARCNLKRRARQQNGKSLGGISGAMHAEEMFGFGARISLEEAPDMRASTAVHRVQIRNR